MGTRITFRADYAAVNEISEASLDDVGVLASSAL